MDKTLRKTFWQIVKDINRYLKPADDPYDILQVLFILMSVKYKVRLNFADKERAFFEKEGNEIFTYLHYAASIFPDQKFYPLKELYERLQSLPYEEFTRIYGELFYRTIIRNKSTYDAIPYPILYTIGNYLKEHNCKSIFHYLSGLPLLTFGVSPDMTYDAVDPRAYIYLLGSMVCHERGIEKHDIELFRKSNIDYDAFVELAPDDSQIEQRLIDLASNKHKYKYAFILIHPHGAIRAYKDSIEELIQSGYLESVITFPGKKSLLYNEYPPTFSDNDSPISLLVINYELQHDNIRFYAADKVFTDNTKDYNGGYLWELDLLRSISEDRLRIVSPDEMAEANYETNAYIYLQDAVCEPGQELVRLSDIAYSWETFEELPEADPLAVEFKVQGDMVVTSVLRCSEASSSVLIPDTDIIDPEYLAYVLRNDPSFCRYLGNLQDDGLFMPDGLMYRMIPMYTDKKKQYEVLQQMNGDAPLIRSYNIVYADSVSDISEGFARILSSNNISVHSHVRSVEELTEYLKDNVGDSDSSFTNIDAVVFNAAIPYSDLEEENEYEGLREVIMLKKDYEIPFYVFSDVPQQELPVPKRHLSYFSDNGRFYASDDLSLSAMTVNLVKELNYLSSDDSVIRNKYPDFYVAAEWLAMNRPGLNMVTRVSRIMKQDLNCSQGEMENTVNDIRIMAENLIRWMQELNIAPAAHLMTPGEVARLLRDLYYKDYTFTEKEFMYKPLASMLVALFDVGNYGSHKFFDTDLYRRTATMILISFVQWVYERREFFTKKNEGFYIYVSSSEKIEFVDVVKCDDSKPTPYYYCRNVHLETSKLKKLKAGDKIRVTDYSAERYPRKDLDVIYYSRSQQWSKIEDEK